MYEVNMNEIKRTAIHSVLLRKFRRVTVYDQLTIDKSFSYYIYHKVSV